MVCGVFSLCVSGEGGEVFGSYGMQLPSGAVNVGWQLYGRRAEVDIGLGTTPDVCIRERAALCWLLSLSCCLHISNSLDLLYKKRLTLAFVALR